MQTAMKRMGPSILIAACALLVAAPLARAQEIKASVPTAGGPYAIAINPVTNKVYVASDTNNVVTVIDGATLQTATVNVGATPVEMDIDTSTNKVFVANGGGSSITVIDGATNATSTIALHGNPASIAVNQVTHKVWVPTSTYNGSYSYGVVELVDEASGSVTDVDRGINPENLEIGINPVTNTIYVPNSHNWMLTTTEINGSDNSYDYVSDATGNVAIDTGTNQIFIANFEPGLVDIDGATGNYSVPPGDGGGYRGGAIAVNEVTHKVYAIGGGLTVYDEATGTSAQVPVGADASAIAIDAASNKVFVSNFFGPGVLSIVDGATNAVSSLSVPPAVFAMAFNPNTGQLYLLGTDAAGTVTVVDTRASAAGPTFAVQPMSQAVSPGSLVALTALPGPGATPTFQWSFNGTPLADGTGVSGSAMSTLFLSHVSPASAGSYTCTITNALGSATSNPAVLTEVSATSPGHLINLSCRAFVGLDGNLQQSDLIAGFVIGGAGSKSVVLRGVGPALAAFNVPGAASSLLLSLFDAAAAPNLITSDAAWQTPPAAPAGPWASRASPQDATAADFQAVGAFAFAGGSADTALKVTLPSGGYTSQISVPAGAENVALAEVYDPDLPGAASVLLNLSARSSVGSGSNAMVAGFVISGSTSQTILIRASGPALAPFGISHVLPQPQLTLFNGSQILIASNIGWQGNPVIAQVAANVGAFAWDPPRAPIPRSLSRCRPETTPRRSRARPRAAPGWSRCTRFPDPGTRGLPRRGGPGISGPGGDLIAGPGQREATKCRAVDLHIRTHLRVYSIRSWEACCR